MGTTASNLCEDWCDRIPGGGKLPRAYEALPAEDKQLIETAIEMDTREEEVLKRLRTGAGTSPDGNGLSKSDIFTILYSKVKTDYEFFMRVDAKWHFSRSPILLDHEKFILAYHNYRQDQIMMERYWDKVDFSTLVHTEFLRDAHEVIMPEWKYLIRRGVPMARMSDVILHLYKRRFLDNETEYRTKSKVIFGDKIPTSFKNTPTFGMEGTVLEVLMITMLNSDGIIALKRICWIFKESFKQLEGGFSPMIPHILDMLLMFVSEAEAYCVVRMMLEQSLNLLDESHQYKASELKSLRWHFSFTESDFSKIVQTFVDTVSSKSTSFTEMIAHFDNIKFGYMDMFTTWFLYIFKGFLPYSLLIKAVVFFLNEGIKIYYRLAYSLLRSFKEEILAHQDPDTMVEKIRSLGLALDADGIKKVLRNMWSLRLTSLKNRFSKVNVGGEQVNKDGSPTLVLQHSSTGGKISLTQRPDSLRNGVSIGHNMSISVNRKALYRPHVMESSKIIPDEMFEVLWEWIPNIHKISDPNLIFATWRDGCSLNNLYKRAENFVGCGMIMLIRTDRGNVIGVFCDEMIHCVVEKPGDSFPPFYGSNETFLFTLKPSEKVYPATEKNTHHILSTKDGITIGSGKSGAALSIDEELDKCYSNVSETYANDLLNGSSNPSDNLFKCVDLEIFALE